MTEITYSPLDFNNPAEILKAARIHENAPINWDPEFVLKPGRLQTRIDFLNGAVANNDLFLITARDATHDIIGLHWLHLTEKYGECCAHIESLWVADAHRGAGIGLELKRCGEEWAKKRGAKFITTDVFYSNTKMIDFNFKCGFKARQVEMIKEF